MVTEIGIIRNVESPTSSQPQVLSAIYPVLDRPRLGEQLPDDSHTYRIGAVAACAAVRADCDAIGECVLSEFSIVIILAFGHRTEED